MLNFLWFIIFLIAWVLQTRYDGIRASTTYTPSYFLIIFERAFFYFLFSISWEKMQLFITARYTDSSRKCLVSCTLKHNTLFLAPYYKYLIIRTKQCMKSLQYVCLWCCETWNLYQSVFTCKEMETIFSHLLESSCEISCELTLIAIMAFYTSSRIYVYLIICLKAVV